MATKKPRVLIVTPALASANNGNWRTTARWQRFLAPHYQVQATRTYDGQPADLMLALHARRSAQSIAQFAQTGKPLAVVLTGTDLYRDIQNDASAKQSLALADKLVVLQAEGLNELSPEQRAKCVVIEQSAPQLSALPARQRTFDLVMVGHIRAEKDPLTAVNALGRLADPALRLRHVGNTDDPQLGPAVRAAARQDSRIELHGALAHNQTRRLIRQGRLLLLPSVMEGGANVLIEAVTADIPVLASRISGSIGMLGTDYPGYFDVGDAAQLASLIGRCRQEPAFLARLSLDCAARAPLFSPERERDGVVDLAQSLLRNGQENQDQTRH